MRHLFAILAVILGSVTIAEAQVVRAVDGFAQFKDMSQGLIADVNCRTDVSSSNLARLPGSGPPPIKVAIEVSAIADGQRLAEAQRNWDPLGLAHLRLHWSQPLKSATPRRNCGLDVQGSAWIPSSGSSLVALDAAQVFSFKSSALRLLAVGQWTKSGSEADALHSQTLVGVGASFITPNFYRFSPLNWIVGRTKLGTKDRFDVRARLIARQDAVRDDRGTAPREWRARPLVGASTSLVVREVKFGLRYQVDFRPAVPGAGKYLEQTTSMALGPFGKSRFLVFRFTASRWAGQLSDHQFAIHAGWSALQ